MGFCNSVQNDQLFVVERCGKFNRIAQPGFLCLPIPGIWRIAGKVSTRISQLDVLVETKTRDNVFLQLQVTVHYVIKGDKVYESFYSLSSQREQIRCYVFDVVRAQVPCMDLDSVFESKDDVATAVKDQLKSIMDGYGLLIVKCLVTDVAPDEVVKGAMNEINTAKRNRIALQEKAEADKLMAVKTAEADAETKFLQGEGIGRQRKAIIDGLCDSVTSFQTANALPAKDILDLVLITQYFDTLKDLSQSAEKQTLFLPHNPGSLSTLATEIKDGIFRQP